MSLLVAITVGAVTCYYLPLEHDTGSGSSGFLPYIYSIDPIQRQINTEGNYVASFCRIIIHDGDLWLRGIVAAKTELKNCTATITTIFPIRQGYTPVLTFNGVIQNWGVMANLNFFLDITDHMSWKLQWNYPVLKLNKTTFPNMPDENVGKSYIYPYGIMDSSSYPNPHGAYDCPCINGYGLYLGVNYNDYMISALPIKSIDAVYREEGGKWIKLLSAQWSYLAGYVPMVIVRVVPQQFTASDTLKTATVNGENHCHVWRVGRFRKYSKIIINGDTVNPYKITDNDSIDMLTITPNIVVGAAQFATVEGVSETTLSAIAVLGADHCHLTDIGCYAIGDKITLGDMATIYTVQSFPGGDVCNVIPNIVTAVASGQTVHLSGESGAMPGLENIRVDVHGINNGTYGVEAALTNAVDVREHFLKTFAAIPSIQFNAASWAAAKTAATTAGLKLAGVINSIKTGIQWDSILGFSSQCDTYIDNSSLICIRLYTTPIAPYNLSFEKERDELANSYQPTTGRQEIYNDLTLSYCNSGDGYYATTNRPDLISIGKKTTGTREESLEFCWDKVSADKVGDMLLVRHAWEQKIINSGSRLLYTITNYIMDLNNILWLEDYSQIDLQTFYSIESLGINPFTGEMQFLGFTT